MTAPLPGGVDCDLHPAVPHLTSLLPYMNDYWRDQVTTRGMVDLVSQSYPNNSPISSRPDWRPAQGKPGSSLADMQKQALGPFKVAYGICNPLYAVQMVFSEDMQEAFCRALNDWLGKEWARQGHALRPGPDPGHGGPALGQARAVADLPPPRTPGPADRHSCRLGLSQSA